MICLNLTTSLDYMSQSLKALSIKSIIVIVFSKIFCGSIFHLQMIRSSLMVGVSIQFSTIRLLSICLNNFLAIAQTAHSTQSSPPLAHLPWLLLSCHWSLLSGLQLLVSLCFHLRWRCHGERSLLCEGALIPCRNMKGWCSRGVFLRVLTWGAKVKPLQSSRKNRRKCLWRDPKFSREGFYRAYDSGSYNVLESVPWSTELHVWAGGFWVEVKLPIKYWEI